MQSCSVGPSIFIDVRIEKVLVVKRMSERLMKVRMIVGRSVAVRRSMVEKEELLAMFGDVVSKINVGKRLLICGDSMARN